MSDGAGEGRLGVRVARDFSRRAAVANLAILRPR